MTKTDPETLTEENPLIDEYPASLLIAEDEHLVATDLAEQVGQLGIEVVGLAADGQRAMELAVEHQPQLALVDICMPNMDGLETAQRMYGELGIPVVIVSAYSDPDYIRAVTQTGVFAYLLKPVTQDDLRTSLGVAWSRFQTERQLSGEVAELKTALEDRKMIERAKGMAMDRLGLSENEAMRWLQKRSRDTRRRLPQVARAILDRDDLSA